MTEIQRLPAEDLRILGNQGFALALRILRHREDAADAVQDAMHQMFRRQSSFDGRRGSVKSWFLKIVRNRCIDMQRKSRPTTGTEVPEPADVGARSPDRQSERNELVASVNQALLELPAEAREILLLRDFDGLSYAEIADVLGLASGTVMSRLHRARQMLREKVIKSNPAG